MQLYRMNFYWEKTHNDIKNIYEDDRIITKYCPIFCNVTP